MSFITEAFDRAWHGWLRVPYKLNYRTYGSGGEPVLLLHGLGADYRAWRPLLKYVGENHTVIMPDLLGFGASPTPDWVPYDVETHTKHVKALLRRFWIDEPITIVGHSMGCLIAAHLAYEQPDMVKRLVLFEPPLFADEPSEQRHARLRSRYFAVFRYIASHPQLLFTENGEFRKQLALISGVSLRPETWVPFKRSLENTVMAQKAFDELHDIAVPTDIIHGRMDFVAPRGEAEKVLSKNKHISFHILNRTHGVSARAAKEIAQILGMKG